MRFSPDLSQNADCAPLESSERPAGLRATQRDAGRRVARPRYAIWSVLALLTAMLGASQRAEAGCGSYIQFRGSPEMVVNPVARLEQARLAAVAKLSPAGSRGHELPGTNGSLPPCHGPHCSRQRTPFVPPGVRIVMLPSQDLIPITLAAPLLMGEEARELADRSVRPQSMPLDILRPPRSRA